MLNNIDNIAIDKRSTVPFELQLKDSIKALIFDQTFIYNTVLPTIGELSLKFDIDTSIIEKAYLSLAKEGYITKSDPYKVTYLELTNHFFFRDTTIYDAIIEIGLTPSIETVKTKNVKLTREENIDIGFRPDETLFYMKRVYKGNDVPIIVLENYLPLSILPGIDQKMVLSEPLGKFMFEQYGLKNVLSNRKTKAVNLPLLEAKLLNQRKNIASIQSVNKVYDQYNRLIDYGISHAVNNYYFEVNISRDEILNYYKK